MKSLSKLSLLAAVVALAACNNSGDYLGDGTTDGFGANGTDTGGFGTDAASNPTTAAYFNQVVGDRILFSVNESTLGAEATSVLAAQANWLVVNPDFTAIIEGHADEQGTREYNLALGARRANSVKEYLVSQGVATGRLQTVTYGKERPIEICSTEACYSQNCRGVTVLSAGAGF